MVDPLVTSDPLDAALRAVWPVPSHALTARVVAGLRVLTLRHMAAGTAAIESALAAHGLAPLPKPGHFLGADPWLLWTRPTECLLLTSHGALADGLLQALSPGREALACALDISAGSLVIELQGPGLDEWLPRLFDASAIPRRAGQGSRTRWIDIGAVIMRLEADRAWLMVDRAHGVHGAQWLAHTMGAVASPA